MTPDEVPELFPVRPLEHCGTGANESQFRMRMGQPPYATAGQRHVSPATIQPRHTVRSRNSCATFVWSSWCWRT